MWWNENNCAIPVQDGTYPHTMHAMSICERALCCEVALMKLMRSRSYETNEKRHTAMMILLPILILGLVLIIRYIVQYDRLRISAACRRYDDNVVQTDVLSF